MHGSIRAVHVELKFLWVANEHHKKSKHKNGKITVHLHVNEKSAWIAFPGRCTRTLALALTKTAQTSSNQLFLQLRLVEGSGNRLGKSMSIYYTLLCTSFLSSLPLFPSVPACLTWNLGNSQPKSMKINILPASWISHAEQIFYRTPSLGAPEEL